MLTKLAAALSQKWVALPLELHLFIKNEEMNGTNWKDDNWKPRKYNSALSTNERGVTPSFHKP